MPPFGRQRFSRAVRRGSSAAGRDSRGAALPPVLTRGGLRPPRLVARHRALARPMPAPAPPRRHSPAARASRSQFAPPPAEVRREERCAFLLENLTIRGEGGGLGAAGSRVMPMRGSIAPPVKPLGGSNVSNAVRCSWSLSRRPRHDERAKRASPASAGVEGGSAGIGRASARCLALNGGRRSLPPVKTGGRAAGREPQPAAELQGISTGTRTAANLNPAPPPPGLFSTPRRPLRPTEVALLRADRPFSKNPDMVPSSAGKPSILRFCRRESLCRAPGGGYTQQPM